MIRPVPSAEGTIQKALLSTGGKIQFGSPRRAAENCAKLFSIFPHVEFTIVSKIGPELLATEAYARFSQCKVLNEQRRHLTNREGFQFLQRENCGHDNLSRYGDEMCKSIDAFERELGNLCANEIPLGPAQGPGPPRRRWRYRPVDYIFSNDLICESLGFSMPAATAFSNWIQDPLCFLQDDSANSFILESIYHDPTKSLEDKFIAECISAESGIMMRPFPLFLEGGNVLAGSNYIVVGASLLTSACRKLYKNIPMSEAKVMVETTFKQFFHVEEVLWPGLDEVTLTYPLRHPSMHLDLFVTLGGTWEGKELVFIADGQRFDHVAKWFERQERFHCVRLPWRFKNYNMYTCNNCIVETGEWRRIYMPRYTNLAAYGMFQDAHEILGRYDFEVVEVPVEFLPHPTSGGSLHCVFKDVLRGGIPSSPVQEIS